MRKLVRLLTRLSLEKAILVGLGLVLLTTGFVGALQFRSVHALVESDRGVAHATEVLHQLEGAISGVKDAESAGRGYVATGDEKLIRPVDLAIADVRGHLQALRRLTADDARQRRSLDELVPLINRKLAFMQELIGVRRDKGFAAAVALIRQGEGIELMNQVRALTAAIEAEEDGLMEARVSASLAAARDVNRAIAFGMLLALGLVLPAGAVIRRHIAERTRAEAALIQERHLLHTLMDNLPDAVYFKDRESLFTRINLAHAKLLGLDAPGQAIGKTDFDFFTDEHAQQAFADEQEIIRTARPLIAKEEKETWPDGRVSWAATTKMPLRDANGNVVGTFGISRNITQHKQAEAALIEERRLLHTLMDNLPDAVYFKDRESRFTRINLALAKLLGLDAPGQATGKTDFDFFADEPAQVFFGDEREIMRTGQPMVGKEEKEIWPDGSVNWISTTKMPVRDADGNIIGTFGVSRDITERKQAQLELSRLNRALRTISRCNEFMVRAQSELELLESVCRNFVEVGGYRMAWVGYVEPDEARTVRPVAQSGFEEGYNGLAKIAWGEDDHGQGPTGSAIRSGQPVVNRNTRTNAALIPWREEALKRGYASSIALPLRIGPHVLGALSLYAVEPDAFDEAEVRLLSELTDDLSFGIDSIRIREDRKRAEEALRESEARFRAVFENAAIGIALVDTHGHPVESNLSLQKMLGYSAFELAQMAFTEFTHPADAQADWDLFTGLKEGNCDQYQLDKRFYRKDGEVVWGRLAFSGVRNRNGEFKYSIGMVEDVSERKRAEEALRSNRNMLASILNSVPQSIFWKDRNGVFLGCNEVFARAAGFEGPEEIIGKTDFDLPTTLQESEAYRADDREVIESRRPKRHIIETLHHADGSPLWIDTSKVPLTDGTGRVYGVLGVYEDITKRKRAEEALQESEERFRGLFENATVGIYRTTPDGRILMANPRLVAMLGYSSFEELACRNLEEEGFEPTDPRSVFRERLEAEQEIRGMEVAWKRRDGSVVFVRESAKAVREDDGRVLFYDGVVEDITEYVLAEDALRESNARFMRIAETIAEVFYICDVDLTKITYVSPAYEQVWGRPVAALLENPQSLLDAVHPQDIGRVLELVTGKNKGQPFDHEYRIFRPDGSLRWIWDRGIPLNDDAGQATSYVGVAQDITERKLAEDRLKESEEKFRIAFMTGADGFFIGATDGAKLIEVNDCFANLFGYTREEVIGKTPSELGLYDGPAARQKLISEYLSKGHVRNLELNGRKKSGEIITALVSINILQGTGGRLALGAVRDITEQKRAEEDLVRLRQAVDASGEVIFMTDPEGIFTFVNPEFTRLYGYTEAEVVGKTTPRILESETMDPTDYARFREAMLSKRITKGETTSKAKDGRLVCVDRSVNPVLNEKGAITGFLAIHRDVTERKRLELQFLQAQKMEAVGRLAAGVAHDFNNLLTIINGHSELLLKRLPPNNSARGPVAEIKDAGERASGLTHQLLAFSRQQVRTSRVLDLNSLVANSTKMLRRLIGEDIELIFRPGPNLSMVSADPAHIEQVLMNLAVNSRDAMPNGGDLTIEVCNFQADQAYANTHYPMPPGPYVMLAVSDTGCGMDEKTRSRVFEPFFNTKGPGKGTGLGLATVYGIVKQNGGYIWVHSELGQGTTFKLFLPAVEGGPEATKEIAALAGGSETVLLVEDDAHLRSLVRTVLEDNGYTVVEAPSALEALLTASRHKGPIHMLLTDVVMPVMNGRQLAERLAKQYPKMKVLYMSGYTDDTVVRHGVLGSSVAYLQKPFALDAMAGKVREVLDM